MVTTREKFRRELRQEAQLWLAEGLIDDSQYEQLAERYKFNTIDTSARNSFVTILIGLGSILIGLGIITFVAANWQDLPRVGKVTLLMSLFVGVNIAGFSLYRQANPAQKRLGHGLLLLGALILGANMGLMGQMFHINAPFYQFLLAWGIGVLAMAYSLSLTSMAVLSHILIAYGYWDYWVNFAQSVWSRTSLIEVSPSSLMVQHMPILAGLMFIPLAYWCRSRWLFVLGAIAVTSSLVANLSRLTESAPEILAIAFALPPALLWAYDNSWRSSQNSRELFQHIAQQLALFYLGVSFYIMSSYWFWDGFGRSLSYPSTATRLYPNWFILLDALILGGLAIFEWWRLIRLARRRDREDNLTTIVIGGFIAIAALVILWNTSIAPIPLVTTFIFNVLLFLLATGLIRQGLARGKRRAFWGGMVLLILRILTWFLLSNTELMLKSLVFILSGIGVIAIGLWFERYVRTLRSEGVRG